MKYFTVPLDKLKDSWRPEDYIEKPYKDGESCGHKGCLHHATHPCEKCGRIQGFDINSEHFPIPKKTAQESLEFVDDWQRREREDRLIVALILVLIAGILFFAVGYAVGQDIPSSYFYEDPVIFSI